MRTNRFLLHMRNIHGVYENAQALNGIDFDVYPGEIHALIGEHRAGTSSLVKILSSAVRKKEGEIVFNGKIGKKVRTESRSTNENVSLSFPAGYLPAGGFSTPELKHTTRHSVPWQRPPWAFPTSAPLA